MYALISHAKPREVSFEPLVWYIGIVENHVPRPIPQGEASKICDLLNAIMQIPEENLKTLLDTLNKVKGGE
jgi:hypothetical protein